MVGEKYGEDFARKVFGAGSEYLFDNTTILDDEDLYLSGIYAEYKKGQYKKGKGEGVKMQIPDYVIEDFGRMTKLEFLE